MVVLTDGRASHPRSVTWPANRLIALRQAETRRGLSRLGCGRAPVRFLPWHDGALAKQGDPRRLRSLLVHLRVRTALVSSPRDFHPDHQAAYALLRQAVANTRVETGTYEVWSRAGQRAGRARDAGVAGKRWAALAHRSQLGNYIRDDPTAFAFHAAAFEDLVMSPEQIRLPVARRRPAYA